MKPKNKIFNGLGFPFVLLSTQVKDTEYGEALDINLNKLSEFAFVALPRKPSRFSGGRSLDGWEVGSKRSHLNRDETYH